MSTITQLLCNNFGGIREKNEQFTSDIITAKDIQNVELYYSGTGVGIRTMNGNISICNTLKNSEKIINIFESVQNERTLCFIHTETETEGKFYLFDINSKELTLKKEGLSLTGISNGFDIQQGWSDLFFFTNGSEMFTYEYLEDEIVDMNNLTDREGRAVFGIVAALFNGRLFIARNNILWYSATANIYDFATAESDWKTTAGYIETLKNITAIHEYLDSLAVFFSDSSELISVADGNFSQSDASPGGCAGVHSLVFHNTDLFFYDNTKKAVFSFKQIVTGEKTLGENCAIEIQNELFNIDSSKLNKIQALSVFVSERNEIWFNIPTNDDYSTILIYDYLKGEWVKRKSQKINSSRIVDNFLYSAGDDGCILEEYVGNDFNGEYIEHYYKCSPFNLGAMNTLKVLAFPPRISMDVRNSNNFYVKFIKNFNLLKKPKIKYIKSKLKKFLYWDIGHFDVDYYPPKHLNNIYKFPNATFKVLEIVP